MKTYKEFINELDTETLNSHGKKRLDQSKQASDAALLASREANTHPYGSDARRVLSKKSYDLDMQAHALGKKAAKSLFKVARRRPDNDRGYGVPGRYYGD